MGSSLGRTTVVRAQPVNLDAAKKEGRVSDLRDRGAAGH